MNVWIFIADDNAKSETANILGGEVEWNAVDFLMRIL